MKPVFYPYKMHSSSAKLLAKAFGSERVRPDGNFQNNYGRPVINWGNSQSPWWLGKHLKQIVLNHPNSVHKAVNKLLSFKAFKDAGVKHPEWTVDKALANSWVKGCDVVARKTLTGKGGEGIVFCSTEEGVIVNAPLYTKYFKKKHEFRVHIVNGTIIDFVQKKQRKDQPANFKIRNCDNGWVFCREGVVLPEEVAEEAIKAVNALGLVFGAVDVGYNESKKEPCVFEVNTAPGIEGTTVTKYAEAFKEYLNAL